MAFSDNLKALPKISHLAGLELVDDQGNVVVTLENKPGQSGSLAVYNHLAQLFGAITPEAAKRGLEIYSEHTLDAQAHPGKHPHIDRLADILAHGGKLRVRQIFFTGQ